MNDELTVSVLHSFFSFSKCYKSCYKTVFLLEPFHCFFSFKDVQYLYLVEFVFLKSILFLFLMSFVSFLDNGFIPDTLLEDVMKALDLVSDPE